ncbi:MAG TPA: peptide-methionine (S)-S-oxide reductase MsrA [Opitutaceae bacterium]|nr:peptide-methionine (S)-S-oxide reductase MsrA [Opitutaceae bacterium]
MSALPFPLNPALLALLLLGPAMNATATSAAPSATPAAATPASAYFGGGCFWCLEAYFETLPGVLAVVSGYAGGRTAQPTYREVCAGTTGHAEVVRIDFDPARTTYEALLEKFWLVHDPTSLDRQGPDEGPQYRSIILYADEAQRRAAEQAREALQQRLADRVVTEIVPLEKFHEAEEYHQDYYRRNPGQGYCRMVIAPKLRKLGVK